MRMEVDVEVEVEVDGERQSTSIYKSRAVCRVRV